MRIFEGIHPDLNINNAVVTVGMYDGVHLAHKLILQRVCSLAKSISGESVLVTFEPHPRLILNPNDQISLLSSRQEKIALIAAIGIDVLIFLPFTLEFSKMSSYEFVKTIMVDAIHARKIVVGYNHYFGHNREGNYAHLSDLGKNFGFEVEEIPEQDIQNESVSSSKIRKALAVGDMMKANTYLDYEYQISGTIAPNQSLFTDFGYFSWSFSIDFANKLIPTDGLYNIQAIIGAKSYSGALFVCTSPDDKKEIQLLLVGKENSLTEEVVSIKFKHLVRICSKQSEKEGMRKSIEAMIYKASQ